MIGLMILGTLAAAVLGCVGGIFLGKRLETEDYARAHFDRGVQAQKDIEFSRHSTATRKGWADRKARLAELQAKAEGLIFGGPTNSATNFPRPMGVERSPHGDA